MATTTPRSTSGTTAACSTAPTQSAATTTSPARPAPSPGTTRGFRGLRRRQQHGHQRRQLQREFFGVYAEEGNNNYASVFGPENSQAVAFEGDHNVATVLDPFGSVASYADSGYGFNNDVTEVLFAHGKTAAVTANNVYDILTALGRSTGMF